MNYSKYFLLLCSFLLMYSCNSDSNLVKNAPRPVKEASSPMVGTKNTSPEQTYDGEVTFAAGDINAEKGKNTCIDITVSNFTNVISMQYTLAWDQTVLDFTGLKGFKLPGLSQQNFGTPLAKNGRLTAVWIDNSLKGVNLKDGSSIYQVCFNPIGEKGAKSPVAFVQKPTPFESVNVNEKLLKVLNTNGSITIN